MINWSNKNEKTNEEKKIYPYYCSLCGSNVLVSDQVLETMPRRKTDESIIALISKFFFKFNSNLTFRYRKNLNPGKNYSNLLLRTFPFPG